MSPHQSTGLWFFAGVNFTTPEVGLYPLKSFLVQAIRRLITKATLLFSTCCQALIQLGKKLAMSMKLVILAPTKAKSLLWGNGINTQTRLTFSSGQVNGLQVFPGLEREHFHCWSNHCYKPDPRISPSWGDITKRRFISLLNLEIHPCPRKERGLSTWNAPEILLDKSTGARLSVPGVGWNNTTTDMSPQLKTFPKLPADRCCCWSRERSSWSPSSRLQICFPEFHNIY